ncbi:hydrophobic/amphiphilic exporter-1, HAE1 family [Nitrosomonas cryotolerans]|uniref:Hydrophobic/amphiphilic exporter-1, HAE1 family n=1 Tax=Nitrosomonas cryotolerans ATCC 49181 TaxID=1131553 RepID=A0A1N6IA11_9PROT|nr:efflux RND transporter permease subunit [Nitrosomonas cryotolerans]SFP83802.1 hydrophobic/amphiphilic exporter-1, HAE1 family [Nitrosomonas cryotolerans]SIO28833.1 hydrophobic/amphiphilic exporter-1, HAE1 family [Nitrosomonas cryotolerans ATCC 49181]
MNLPEFCIRRPVMTVLLSLSIIIAGILAYHGLPIAALPSYDAPTIVINAELPGASPETMASAVATPLERELSAISGLAVISSTSLLGMSAITLEFNQNHSMDSASIDVQAALLRVQPLLPVEMTAPPSYSKINPAEAPIIHLALTSPSLPLADLNNFAENLISPAISTLPGLAQVQINGQKRYAVRIRVNAAALAARNLTMDDLAAVLSTVNANSPIGTLDGPRQTLTIQANRQLDNAAAFANLIVATTRGNAPVRLSDVAQVEDSVESIKSAIWINGERAITLAVQREPGTNTVAAVDAIKALLPELNAQMPSSVRLKLLSDRSVSIRDAIHDIEVTLIVTILLVILVIFFFLRNASAILISALSLMLSLLGTVAAMQLFGYTLNNISLLAITLAVGLVVDDAIVVLENIVRYVEEGMPPLQAALRGSKEVSFTIVSISVSLAAVFIPVFFMPGVIGLLFHEFAAVVGIAVLVSALVSLTLVPVMASQYLTVPVKVKEGGVKWQGWFERGFDALSGAYEYALDRALRHRRIMLGVALSTLIATVVLFMVLPKGFFPSEDTGQAIITVEAVEDISFPAMIHVLQQAEKVIRNHPAVEILSINATNSNHARMFVTLKPRHERPHIDAIAENLRRDVGAIPGIKIFISPIQNLKLGARTSKSRYQYVLRSLHSDKLHQAADKLMSHMLKDQHIFRDVSSDMQLKGLQARLNIDRDKAGLMGVEIDDIRSALYSAFGERQVSTIYAASNRYKVIMQVVAEDQLDESAFGDIHLRGKNDTLIPLSTVVTVEREVGPVAINHTGQLESVTVSFNLASGAALGDAATRLNQLKQTLQIPESILTSYAGDAAAFQSSQMSQIVLIMVALFVVYVLLGVLYESYIHPITVLAGLPSAAVGALAVLWIFNIELSIIAMIGILLLIGIVKKNAIMMIDFALDKQRNAQITPFEAIRAACLLRFRPIMMTTVAALMGALPIALGLGAGAELRQPLGLTVVGGLLFSQVITLFITPVIYLYLDDVFKN